MWRRADRVVMLCAAALAVSACAPSVDQCAMLFPRAVETPAAAQTPVGTPGCTAIADDVPVAVEVRRRLVGFERGRLFVDGAEVELADFEREVRRARLRRAGREIGDSARDALERAADAVEGFFEGLAGENGGDGSDREEDSE